MLRVNGLPMYSEIKHIYCNTEIGETTWRKALQKFLYTLQYFAPHISWAKCHRSVWWGTTTPPPIATCKISCRSDDPSPRYLLPNFVDFIAGVSRVTYKKSTVNDMSQVKSSQVKFVDNFAAKVAG